MTISYRASYSVSSLLVLMLTGCASRAEAQQVLKLRNEVKHLNQRLQTLIDQAKALVAQDVWPDAGTGRFYRAA